MPIKPSLVEPLKSSARDPASKNVAMDEHCIHRWTKRGPFEADSHTANSTQRAFCSVPRSFLFVQARAFFKKSNIPISWRLEVFWPVEEIRDVFRCQQILQDCCESNLWHFSWCSPACLLSYSRLPIISRVG